MTLNPGTLAALSPLANHLWQSSLCILVVWLLTVLLRKNRAAVRYGLWFTASLKFLVPFSVLVTLGSHFTWIKRAAPLATSRQPQWSYVVENFSRPFAGAVAAPVPSPASSVSVLPVLFTVWLCGFLVSLALGFRWWRQMCAARREAISLSFNLRIPVLSSPTLLEPGVFGIFRPILLLPEGITDRLTPAQLRAVLAHEMCHVRRRDNLTAAIHMLVEAVFWFYPLVWLIRARLIEERERACDEAVLQSGADAESYAEGILNVCKFYVESPLACVSGISGADLKKRVVRIMKIPAPAPLNLFGKVLLYVAAFGIVLLLFTFGAMHAAGQASAPDWQAAAGSKMAFEVASIRQNTSEKFTPPLFPLSADDSYTPTGGLFSADFPLSVYIQFAYKIVLTPEEQASMLAPLPKWVTSERFEIHARAPGNPTKDQMRLMMQSLLADRFGLSAHFETHEMPVLTMKLAKSGKLGPQLIPHAQGAPCDAASSSNPNIFPSECSVYAAEARTGRIVIGSRDTTLLLMAGVLPSIGHLGRPLVDQTGLTGRFDFTLHWAPEPEPSTAPTANADHPSDEPNFLEALREQLGLKLVSQKGPVEVLVIDHIERPSEN